MPRIGVGAGVSQLAGLQFLAPMPVEGSDELPVLPEGFAFLTDDAGTYLVDSRQFFLIVPKDSA